MNSRFSVQNCRLLPLRSITDNRGKLTVVEKDIIPFSPQRTYYLYDVPKGSSRGGHAHKTLQQVIVCLSGAFDIDLDDGVNKKRFHLSRPDQGLYLCPMIWREIHDFAEESICLVMASSIYDEEDYIRDYSKFKVQTAQLQQ